MPSIIEYHFVDKTAWGPGPWQDEPDKCQWIDPSTDLDCLAVRHPRYGHWCGYVGVPEGHPAYEQKYDAVPVEAHGGLTFAGPCQGDEDDEDTEEQGVCHVPLPGRPEKIWWLGFDAAHIWDLGPGRPSLYDSLGITGNSIFALPAACPEEVYRDLPYIREECASLAKQLRDLGEDGKDDASGG